MDEVVLTWLESNCFLNPKPRVGNMIYKFPTGFACGRVHKLPSLQMGWSNLLDLLRTKLLSSCPLGLQLYNTNYLHLEYHSSVCTWSSPPPRPHPPLTTSYKIPTTCPHERTTKKKLGHLFTFICSHEIYGSWVHHVGRELIDWDQTKSGPFGEDQHAGEESLPSV